MIYSFCLKEIWKNWKTLANFHDKEKNVIRERNLKQTLNHGSVLEKVHRVMKSNQKVWLKPNITMNTELRKNAKTYFENFFLQSIEQCSFYKSYRKYEKR